MIVTVYIEGFRLEWYINTVIYSPHIPFWSEILNMKRRMAIIMLTIMVILLEQ